MSFIGGPADYGFTLLPPDPGVISPDLALDAALAPVVELGPPAAQPLGKGWRFDFLAGQFVQRGTSPMEVSGTDQFTVWAEKCLRTARRAHPIYDAEGFGMEYPFREIGLVMDIEILAGLSEAITEALMVHDRVVAVENFQYSQDPFDEALYASFSVTLDAAPPLTPEAQIIEFTQIPVSP